MAQVRAPSVTRLGNGLTVIMQEDHSIDLIGIEVWVKAGIANETADNNGISHLVEHLLFAGTEKRQTGDMDREIESVGATLDAYTGVDYMHFGATICSRYLNKSLDIFADAINNSQFHGDDLERERLVILDELARKQSSIRLVARSLLAQKIYGPHPYSLPLEGTAANVKNISHNDLLAYYREHYTPTNMALVLVGDFDPSAAFAEIKKLFQSAPREYKTNPRPEIPPITKQISESVKASLDDDYLAIGFLGPDSSQSEDVCALDVLMSYLVRGNRGWIFEELKTKSKLVNDAHVDFVTCRDKGLISIIVSTTPDNQVKVQEAILAKLEQIGSKGMSGYELENAKRSVLGQIAYERETVSGRANAFGFYFAVSDVSFAVKYQACISSLTAEAVRQTAKKYLIADSAVILRLEPSREGSK